MAIPLEDSFTDVLGKARRGLGLSLEELAAQAGVDPAAVQAAFDGRAEDQTLRALAKPLHLQGDRLVALAQGGYRAADVSLPGLEQYNTQFDDMTVNAYLVWDAASKRAVVFDTGADCDGILETVEKEGLTVALILLTHSHGDHIYDLDRLREKTGAEAWIGEKEQIVGATPFAPGKTFEAGALRIESRLTWGHCAGGITYVVQGVAKPVAVVGDAIFAGSMGGGGISYEAALQTNRDAIFSLSDETILCPGHGPMTTVGEQKKANPFFPEF